MSALPVGSPADDPVVLEGVLARVGRPDFAGWQAAVAHAGHCAHPIRLAGEVAEVDRVSGEVRSTFSTTGLPDGVLLVACGNRRASVCPACAEVYRADAFQLVRAGLAGGKGVPESVAVHPALFVTLTAPGFGLVHSRRAHGRTAAWCLPRRGGRRCAHGRPQACWARHDEADPRIGTPICPDCFDYPGQVIWNAVVPDLWRRTTIYLRRALARHVGVTVGRLGELVRLSYVKVAEYQARGAVHLHVVIRLDAAGPAELPPAPPPAGFTTDLLAAALRTAVLTVSVPCPHPCDRDRMGLARWGEQLDLRPICLDEADGGLSAAAVAGYIAKYATKSTDSVGRLDRWLRPAQDDLLGWPDLDALGLPDHLYRLVAACWRLGARPGLAGLRRWAHTLGFGGHFASKSRGYSTTFTVLRTARRAHAGDAEPLDAFGRPASAQAVVVWARWRFAGAGHRTPGDRWLALQAADAARARRQAAHEARCTQVV